MASRKLKKKIHETLKSKFKGDNEFVDVSDGFEDGIHVVVVSRRLNNLGLMERTKAITDVLLKKLEPDEWIKVTLVAGHSLDELKTF